MKAILLGLTLLVVAGITGCTTYQERIIDEGTVVEQRTVVE